ncbi:diguanylate cyclase domain-containing protein [Nitrincola sp. MINF-07-Sa-05]|uniref:diguanylate cyclase domain-containing protein n=1 Tax=Nitrincola salilacus TaxID=3400273 RepID=UPI00391846B1
MSKHVPPDASTSVQALQAEIIRLNKIIQALMNRAERNDSLRGSDFSLFHTAITLEEQVHRRTMELEAARLENEKITRDLRESEKQIRRLAFYDTLTQLANRSLLTDRLKHAMAASARSGCYGAVMFLDLDNFKPPNDIHGHDAGDLLLIEVANRLTGCVRSMDTVARIGGDEFVVMLGELDQDYESSMERSGIVAEKVRATIAEPYILIRTKDEDTATTVEHHCTASIGVALFIDHQASQEEILKWADLAMYQAKKEGRNIVRYFEHAS